MLVRQQHTSLLASQLASLVWFLVSAARIAARLTKDDTSWPQLKSLCKQNYILLKIRFPRVQQDIPAITRAVGRAPLAAQKPLVSLPSCVQPRIQQLQKPRKIFKIH